MGKNSEINKLISNEETLFSGGSYEFPVLPQEDKPFYNPNINALYIPKFDKRLIKNVAGIHETNHKDLSRFPAICFLQTLAQLIYHQFSLEKYDPATNIIPLLPENNPTVKMLKGIWKTVLESTRYILEASAISHSLGLSKVKIRKKGGNPKELEQHFVKKTEKELPEFKELYRHFSALARSHKVFRNIPFYYLHFFPLDGPSFLPEVPVKNGQLNGEKITEEVADEAVEKFRSIYQELPYSPKKRLKAVISILEGMIKNGVELNPENLREEINAHRDFSNRRFPELKRKETDPESCYHCPVETLNSKGISVPWFDYGSPSGYYSHPEHEKINCKLSRKLGTGYDELSRKAKSLDELNRIKLKIDKNKPPELSSTEFCPITRSAGYAANWPLSSFLTASEILRYFVFHPSKCQELFSQLTLVETIAFPPDGMTWGVPSSKPPKPSKSQKISPFITLETIRAEESEESEKQMGYRLE